MYTTWLKPVFDFILATISLAIILPLLILIIIIARMLHGKNILFKQVRVGKNNRTFKIYKFRTMEDYPESVNLPSNLRLTKFGRFLRKSSLDELPQIFNILKGDMSFIGPRPLIARDLTSTIPERFNRHKIKPGITGWAQINGRNTINWESKFILDCWYIDNISFLLDMKILIVTILKVLSSEGV